MGLFDKIKEPIILKHESAATVQLEELQKLLEDVKDAKAKTVLEREIQIVKAGILGENRILFELENSHMPFYILHDLQLEFQGLSSQIDFLVITRGRYFVIECKNLYGDITVNYSGDFIRTAWKHKEGIYSPITQCKRHLDLIKQIRGNEKGNILTRALFERYFYENYRSIVVLANPKTILDVKYAPKNIREQVIRADQLIQYIQKINSESGVTLSSERDTEELANFFLRQHRTSKLDYTEKFREILSATESQANVSVEPSVNDSLDLPKAEKSVQQAVSSDSALKAPICPKCGAPMVKRKAVRGERAGKEFWGCSRFPHCHGIINI